MKIHLTESLSSLCGPVICVAKRGAASCTQTGCMVPGIELVSIVLLCYYAAGSAVV